jgi:hypothetical protein
VPWSGAAESRWASNSSGSIDRSDAIKSAMRSIFFPVIVALLPASMALAQSGNPKTDLSITPGKLLPVKQPHAGNSCAAYGPDYVKVEGTGMCVQISGSVSVGVGGSIGAR